MYKATCDIDGESFHVPWPYNIVRYLGIINRTMEDIFHW